MQGAESGVALDFESRLRRSQGRAGRKHVASAKVTEAEYRELQTSARGDGKALSEWARDVLLREARSSRADALFTEIVATRMLLNLVLKPLATGQTISADEFSGVLTTVRTTKHTAATDVMKQYASADQKGR